LSVKGNSNQNREYKFMQRFFSRYIDGAPGIGLLILRVVAGIGLMLHGWGKIQKPFAWMGPDGPPGVIQALGALGEFGGGLGLALGLLTPLAAFGALCTMSGAWFFSHQGDPWVPPPGWKGKTFELASMYGLIALTLIFTGPGRFSLDALLFGKGKR
jgi:putative oxidoreductase